jgi:hypothetical protein
LLKVLISGITSGPPKMFFGTIKTTELSLMIDVILAANEKKTQN